MLAFVLLASFIIAALIVLIIYLNPASKRSTTVPGPPRTDEIEGNLPDIAASDGLNNFLIKLHSTYGKIASFWLGEHLCISLANPELFKEQANMFDRPKQLTEQFEPLLTPHSIQYTNGKEGRRRLAVYGKSYNFTALKGNLHTFLHYAQKMKQKWTDMPKEEHIPLAENMLSFSVETMIDASFGINMDNKEDVLDFKTAYDVTMTELDRRLYDGILPDAARLERFEKYIEIFRNLMLKSAKNAKANPPTDGEPKRFVDALHDLGLSDDIIAADMITMSVAGIHTTGYLLTWAIYFMAVHQDVQEKIYDELITILGEEPIVYEAVTELVYMRQVIDETLRCSVLASSAARVQEIDIEIGGHKIAAGTPVVHAIGALLQDETIWTEPKKFDPERFSKENKKKIPTYAFEPFGFAGKRRCVGYRFTYLEATVLLSELIRKFKFQLVEGQVVQKVYGIITKPKEEIWITLQKRT